ncbi:MAG: NAD(P)/FAD-dependent oxidoreductase [bacterium]|nr:NAD(P)/FAD-dependent oxidoreductase [bacterium]
MYEATTSRSSAGPWDVIVIGGGPAGMMAAGRAAELDARVLLIEQNPELGKKLLITGGGRCNLTNGELDTRKFLSKFRKNDQFLFSAFAQFGVKETLDFFHTNGVPTKVEEGLRVFPVSNRAVSVRDALVKYLKRGKVTVSCDSAVTGFVRRGDVIEAVRVRNKGSVRARSFVIATGGKSRPETGSTGDGFRWLADMGHTIAEQEAALVPVSLGDVWARRLSGVVLPDVKLTVVQNGVKQDSKKGRLLFTHFGVSGPMVLNMSRDIGELLKYGEVSLLLDLFPSLDHGALDRQVLEIVDAEKNRHFKNVLGGLVPAALAPILVERAGIRDTTACHSLTREERERFVRQAKALELHVTGLLGVMRAVVTSGGVALAEVDFKTMRSRKVPNLYLVGDVLDIDRPSGGYSLQLCWTTGFVAGSSAVDEQR